MSAPIPTSPSQQAGAYQPAKSSSYGQILKSSVLIGGSSLINVGAAVIRSKATAMLLGPAGFGLMGLFYSILSFAQSVALIGIGSSGVRQIAAAVGSGESERIARTAAAVRWSSIGLGVLGGLLLAALADPVATLTFGNAERAAAVGLLGIAVTLRVMADGNGALLQGLRRIADIASIGVLNGLLGTIATIVLVYFFREQGVVPAIIAFTGIAFVLSWWYARKAPAARGVLTAASFRHETRALVKLGFAFMVSGLLMTGAGYAVRLVVAREIGMDAAGYYHAAWAIGSMYVGFVLESMAADFYPRLTAAVADRSACNRLVNEQAQISLLLAGPGVLGTITLAPLVVSLLYSSAFAESIEVLRWLCLGVALRVITWPMGFIIVAHARQTIFLVVEVAYAAVYIGSTWLLVGRFGLAGTGVAFLASYVFHGVVLYPIVHRMTGFTWSAINRRLIAWFVAASVAVFCAFQFLPAWVALCFGVAATALSAMYSMRTIAALVQLDRLPRPIRKLAKWMNLA